MKYHIDKPKQNWIPIANTKNLLVNIINIGKVKNINIYYIDIKNNFLYLNHLCFTWQINMLIDFKNIDIINIDDIKNIDNIDSINNIDNFFFPLSLQIIVNDSVRTLSLIAHSTFRGFGLSIFRRFEVSAFRTTLARPAVDFELASDAEATPEMK